jgi:heme-degrading monooxygenase HmoA
LFVSINHIPVKAGREDDFENLFRQRERHVENQPGFISLDILKPGMRSIPGGKPEPNGNEYQVMTRWQSEADFRGWISSDSFKKSHARDTDPTIFDGKSYLTFHQTVDGAGAP